MKIVYGIVSIILGLAWTVAAAEPLKPVVLPAPQMDKGRPPKRNCGRNRRLS